MILHGAYLVDAAAQAQFRDEVGAVARGRGDDGVDFELTGPWPPYNFAEGDEPS